MLRYPGGKSRLIKKIAPHFPAEVKVYGEMFTGGGGSLVWALANYPNAEFITAEINPQMRAFWENLDEVLDFVQTTPELTLDIYNTAFTYLPDSISALVQNKGSFGGLMGRNRPIGGLDQSGDYKVGCRWNQTALINKLSRLIELSNGRLTVTDNAFTTDWASCDFVYSDPPYWHAGQGLYKTDFDHVKLHSVLDALPSWVLSYDDVDWVRTQYKEYRITELISFSAIKKVITNELIIIKGS